MILYHTHGRGYQDETKTTEQVLHIIDLLPECMNTTMNIGVV
jgi:hypothetical protein